MKSLFFTIVLIYILLCIALFFFQRKLLYHPTPKTNITNEKEISFNIDGMKLYGWILNEGKDKALIYYGGNAESIELNINFFNNYLPEYTIYLVNYRGYGKSEGNPSEKRLKSDALAIFDEIENKYNSISIIGRSLGTGIATYIATKKDVDKLILVSPYNSVENVAKDLYSLFPVSLLLKDKFDSTKNIESIKSDTLIIYGGNDDIIPRKYTEDLISYFNDKHLKIVLIDRAQHNDIEVFSDYKKSINEFLD